MKIKNLATIILMIILFISLITKVEATTGTIKSKEVNLRKKPNSSSTILDIIYKGDEVEILEQEDGWYKIKVKTSLGKVTGYVSEKEVDIKKEEAPKNPENKIENTTVEEEKTKTETIVDETNHNENSNIVEAENEKTENVIVAKEIEEKHKYQLTQEISIKVLPLMNSREKTKVTGEITVIEIINDWARVENDIESGWIRKNILQAAVEVRENIAAENVNKAEQEESTEEINSSEEQPVEEVQEEIKTEQKEQEKEEIKELNKIGYVSSEGLRVRKGPSTDTEEIHSLSKNSKVQIIGQEGKWYKIDLNGKIGYVSVKYISDTKIPETTSRSGSTLKNETVTEQVVQQEEKTKVEEETVKTQSSNSGTTGTAIVEYAKQYLGYKYVSGGASPSKGFDCSGFTSYVYKHFGISVNRTSRDQIKNGVAVNKSDLQPGDLVVFNNDSNTAIGHVGIYIGDGNFIHASNPKGGVKITTLLSGYYKERYVGARRVI